MITKKKGLYLGLLVSMLGIGNAMQAYEVTVKNNTPLTVKFKLKFSSEVPSFCQFAQELPAEGIAKETLWCCGVIGLEATVQRLGSPAVKAKPYVSRLGDMAGDRTFIISGSDETGYTVFLKSRGFFGNGKLISSK